MSATDFEVELILHNIEKCGLYEATEQGRRQIVHKNDVPKCLGIEELLTEVEQWAIASGQALANTCPDTIPDEKKIYCYNITKLQDTFLAAFWVALPRGRAGVSTLPGNRPVKGEIPKNPKGNLDVHDIPGFMAYFLFLPKLNRLATVQLWFKGFGKPYVSTPKLKSYLEAYMNGHSLYRCKDGGFSEKKASDPTQVLNSSLVSKVDWSRRYGDSELDTVKKYASDIYKVTYQIKQPDLIPKTANRQLWQAKESVAGYINHNGDFDKKRQIRMVVPVAGMLQSEVEELEQNFEQFTKEQAFNVGFQISGHGREYWLSGSYSKEGDTINLKTQKGNREFPDQNAFHKELLSRFGSFLRSS